ncbi:hypothetical protein [[Mycobacterium] crassicus]|uniref:DUF2207 domain-containing protein n=1 Tax=[Mycobacterium] crassicus TaxID=2872309 RepID=A0ABU5XDY4_9MYCO|nr:hypothetical protein [Mycolicibacter sp. MYC098]MEB3020386.1 hypothetical protein [Mycolicibacter sp. MYC098]
MANKAKWPASYVVPSVALSLTSAGFLLWHIIDRTAHIDGWAITLLVVGFSPWLRTIFESIEFPGGGSLKYQKLEARQEQQGDEIKALQFLVANFLTGDEAKYLLTFASPDPVRFGGDYDSAKAFEAVTRLKQIGFVRGKTDLSPAALVGADQTDLKTLFEITELGHQYLKLRDSTSPA